MMVLSINLGKDGKFLPEELVGEVHSSVQDTCDMNQNSGRSLLFACLIVNNVVKLIVALMNI